MFMRRSDLPFDEDGLARFLPWLIAFMVFLATMAMAGALALSVTAGRWDKGISATLTVQIPATLAPKAQEKAIARALKILRAEPAVVSAEQISESRIMALLEPWLGTAGEDMRDLPLPILIDVNLDPDAVVDVAALAGRLSAQVPGATADDHGAWLNRLVSLIHWVQAVTLAVLGLILLVSVGTVVFATRTGLAIHHEAIEVLHLIGAHDSYVAKQFAFRALALGFKGGVMGLALAAPTLWGIGLLTDRMEAGLLPDFTLTSAHWLALASLPVFAGLIAMLTARRTVMKTLSEML
ncbi:MAG TPA: FtsX-like permease family protein [Alphaproteobacteria bacterium]|nr:FtsX-like permease family protein [Alphaproteobacteria bacterium]